jgi:photosystem II stability/assembly factor-like uncharacterized protein
VDGAAARCQDGSTRPVIEEGTVRHNDRIEAALRRLPSRVRAGGARPLVALLVVVVVAGASLTFGLYGPLHLARSGPAGTPTVEGTDQGENSLSPEQIAQASVVTSGQIRSGGFWAMKGSALLVSTDYGQTWRAHSIPRANMNTLVGNAVFVLDADHAWAITDIHTIYRSSDGGASWAAANLPDNCGIQIGLSFVDATVGYVICLDDYARATVMRTGDGGATWTVITTNATTDSGPIGSVMEATDEQTLWAASNDFDNGTQALLAVSRNGGATWTDAKLPGVPAANVRAEDAGKPGWSASLPTFVTPEDGLVGVVDRSIGSSGGRFFGTDDGGRTWKEEPQASGQNRSPAAVLTMDSWVAYDDSPPQILHTSDGGAHWTAVAAGGLPDPAYFYGFAFSDELYGMAKVGSVLLVTSDGGATWTAPDLAAAAAGLVPATGDDEAAVRATVEAYEQARLAGNVAAENAVLSPLSQIVPVDTPDATPAPVPAGFEIVSVARTGLNLDPAAGYENVDVLGEADYSRAFAVTVRVTFDRGSTTDEKLLVAPLLGAGWRIWTPSDLTVSPK